MLKNFINKILNVKNNIYNMTLNLFKKLSFNQQPNYSIIKTNYGYNISFDAQNKINLKCLDKKLLINKAVIITANIKDTSLNYIRAVTLSKKSIIIKDINDYNKFINNAYADIMLFYENMQLNYEDVDIIDLTFKIIEIKNER